MDVIKAHRELFEIIKPEIYKFGFDTSDYQPHFCSLDFKKKKNKVINHITLQFYNDSLGINALQGRVILNEVNDILRKFVDLKVNREYETLNNFEFKNLIQKDIKKLNSISKYKNKTDYSFDILEHIEKVVIPFFNFYPDMQTINHNILNTVPIKDYPDWIHGQSTLKILIIMRLCNNPNFDSYRKNKEKEYIAFVNRDSTMWQPAYDTFLSLIKYLND
ncbi:hypothetical protein KO493_10925 [Tamlana agarivorans]|uniref:Uncharacterized protein n=1 Tax=Pseudotamlana agarivorans TaxID=481183 RepID=A0ACC5UAA3_9FLAO|nr:hypothetical protein [Tamlana agarivorans]MBU2951210.1 hypothetical protein [Tamlana agarivorans]